MDDRVILEYVFVQIPESDLDEGLKDAAEEGWELHTIQFSAKPGIPGGGYARCVFERPAR